MDSAVKPGIGSLLKPLDHNANGGVGGVASDYLTYFDQSATKDGRDEAAVEARRKQEALAVSNAYYDLATDFYEYGWGESFHFAVLRPGESREHAFAKHEYYLALKMELKRGQRVLVRIQTVSVFIHGAAAWCLHETAV